MKVFMAKLNEMMECTICFKEMLMTTPICFKEMLMTTPILKGTLTERLLKEKKKKKRGRKKKKKKNLHVLLE
jgi:hypothetical protein